MCKVGGRVVALLAALGIALSASPAASAAGPEIEATWATDVSASSALLHAGIDTGGFPTSYRFHYIAASRYEANLAQGKDPFSGAAATKLVAGANPTDSVWMLSKPEAVLAPETSYRYRAFASNKDGTAFGLERTFRTRPLGSSLALLDDRGWEMVSPVDKNGGEIQGFGGIAGGGVLQAAEGGGAVTFGSTSSFGEGGQGAPGASQYMARRTPGGWITENITAPLASGAYGDEPDGVPYQLFSAGLSRGLLAAPSYPPFVGTGAPAGYSNYYLRDNVSGGSGALLTQGDVGTLAIPPAEFELDLSGGSGSLGHVVLSTCAALTPDAAEIPTGPESCDPDSPNLYAWSPGSGLTAVNLLPAMATSAPGAQLAAPSGAVSANGARIYWTVAGALYLREAGVSTVQVDQAVGGGGIFQTAAADGSVAFFTKAGHLYRYVAASKAITDLTPAGGVEGVLGASAGGSFVYYLAGGGLFLNREGSNSQVAAAADESNVPPSTGTARVTPDGRHLAFISSAELTGYDNIGESTGEPVTEAYLYDADRDALTCVSCNPTGARPLGPSSIPGAIVNGVGEGATRGLKPRALSSDGRRVFFDSRDSLVLQDTNNDLDVYEWEAQGTGSCHSAGGCLQLISDGRGAVGASFVDASADGADVFFLTDRSLVPADPGSVDLYDAREGGGFAEPPDPIPCEGDSCQPLPSPPDDPVPGTLVPNSGNPPTHFDKPKKKKKKQKKRQRQRRRQR